MARISQISWRTFAAESSAGFSVSQNFILLTAQTSRRPRLVRTSRRIESTKLQHPSTRETPNPETENRRKFETRKEFDRGWRGFHRFLGGRSQLKVAQVFNHCCIAEFYSADRPTLPTDTVR